MRAEAGSRTNQLTDNTAMHRFEMPLGDDVAVAYYQEQNGRVVLLHTEVPNQYSEQGIGSRLARGIRGAQTTGAACRGQVPLHVGVCGEASGISCHAGRLRSGRLSCR